MLAGQMIVGGCVSFTVTVNVQFGPACSQPVTFKTMCMLGKPNAAVVIGVGSPQSAALI
jgi:hypothetical protein